MSTLSSVVWRTLSDKLLFQLPELRSRLSGRLAPLTLSSVVVSAESSVLHVQPHQQRLLLVQPAHGIQGRQQLLHSRSGSWERSPAW